MVRLKFSIDLAYEILNGPADFIFNFHAAPTAHQTILNEKLVLDPVVPSTLSEDILVHQRLLRLRANPGPLRISYQAEVEIQHHTAPPDAIREMSLAEIPNEVLTYLYPSRYCESDKLQKVAHQHFGQLAPGYQRVEAIRQWVYERIRFTSGSSDFTTSAVDTLAQGKGVCRDFAHLMIALCRALNIPARFASAIDYGADPALGPTDFHAYVEVYLDARWYIFDPSGTATPMGFIRIGTGRDAADISFATIFGDIRFTVPLLSIEAMNDPAQGYVLPQHCSDALSTDTPKRRESALR